MTISKTGNVGIGTTNPGGTLHVFQRLFVQRSLSVAAATAYGGKVGIGTITPATALM